MSLPVSIIFTTYNATRWLEKVLWGYEQQSYTNFEIIIADDGSGEETRDLIKRVNNETSLKLRHIWHEDNGFQKCRILNKAILHAQHDYVIFSDGDCIPRQDFVAEHVKNAEPGHYLSGSYYKLPLPTSEVINKQDVISQQCFDVSWLYQNGLPKTRKTLKLRAGAKSAAWLNQLTPAKCNLKGSNASCWLEDILAVNGFDERMQWGGLDREFGVRLINQGIKSKHVRYNAICIHLDHPRGYKDKAMVASNNKLRIHNEKKGVTWTEHGIQQLLDGGYVAQDSEVSERARAINSVRLGQ